MFSQVDLPILAEAPENYNALPQSGRCLSFKDSLVDILVPGVVVLEDEGELLKLEPGGGSLATGGATQKPGIKVVPARASCSKQVPPLNLAFWFLCGHVLIHHHPPCCSRPKALRSRTMLTGLTASLWAK